MENSLKPFVVKQIHPQTHKWHLCTAVRDTFSFFTLGKCQIEFRGLTPFHIGKKYIDSMWN